MAKGGFEEDGIRPVREFQPLKENQSKGESNKDNHQNKVNNLKSIQIKVNPTKIARASLLVIIVLGIFFLGRLSADSFELTGLATSDSIETAGINENSNEDQAANLKTTEVAAEETTEAIVKETAEPDSSGEVVVNAYKNTQIVINGLQTVWKEDWGQITGLDYTIKNNEEGAINPGYFKVMVQGYKDVEKIATLPAELQLVHKGETQVGKIDLDKPFNYNEKNTGNLRQVKVIVVLFNNDPDLPKAMASYQQEFNLQG